MTKEINPLELIHDFLIEEGILNLVLFSNDRGVEQLMLVAPISIYPAVTIATIWVRPAWESEGRGVQACLRSPLLELIKCEKTGDYTSLNLEDPESLDKIVGFLGELVVEYNRFALIMKEFGADLLKHHLVWDEVIFCPTKLKR